MRPPSSLPPSSLAAVARHAQASSMQRGTSMRGLCGDPAALCAIARSNSEPGYSSSSPATPLGLKRLLSGGALGLGLGGGAASSSPRAEKVAEDDEHDEEHSDDDPSDDEHEHEGQASGGGGGGGGAGATQGARAGSSILAPQQWNRLKWTVLGALKFGMPTAAGAASAAAHGGGPSDAYSML